MNYEDKVGIAVTTGIIGAFGLICACALAFESELVFWFSLSITLLLVALYFSIAARKDSK